MNKAIITCLLFFVYNFSFSQADTSPLKKSIVLLDMALLQKDTITLKKLLHPKVTYGHSNGWVEEKKDVIKDVATGYLNYEKLETSELKITSDNDWASARMNVEAKGTVNNKPFEMKLYVLQVWRRINKMWMLVARQGAKL